MKTCTTCGELKPLSEFHKRANRPSGYTPACKACKSAAAAEYRKKNSDACKARSLGWHKENRVRSIKRTREWQEKHADRHMETQRMWREANASKRAASWIDWAQKNAEHVSAIRREYTRKNLPKFAAYARKRRAVQLQAMPIWADEDLILEAYELAKLRTAATGIKWVVDHVVPLCSPSVCGLHVIANLQVVTEAYNARKGNRWWPDSHNIPQDAGGYA